jgi:hypothetical protein
MQNPDLNVYAASPNATASGAKGLGGVLRRQFLQTLGVVGIAAALSPESLFAQAPSEDKEWRDLVNNFIFVVAEPSQAQAMTAQLNRTQVYYQSRQGLPLHMAHSSPYIFVGSNIDPRRVICENGFQVVQLPYYDSGCPCRGVNDMNASEIYRITDPDEIKRFGCVLVPDGPRTQLDYSDHAHYVGRAASDYQLNVNDWYVPYKRKVSGRRRSHTGYQFVHRTRRNVHGKPVTDFIVSGDI